ncbi:hypothetical protein D3C76_1426440 [compost metagenome]
MIDEGVAQAVAQAIPEELHRPVVQVVSGQVDVRCHLRNLGRNVVAQLQRLRKHPGGHVADRLRVRGQQGGLGQARLVDLIVFCWVFRQQRLASSAHGHGPAHERRDHRPVSAHLVDSWQGEARVIAHVHILRGWLAVMSTLIG